MKYVDEYRDADVVASLADAIRRAATKPHVIMEVCGGQTHSILRYGLDRMLPEHVELVHGPGCPVCVTALETIDRAHAIAKRPDVIFTSFGDMLRVPGSTGDLLALRARGADVRVVYSPLDAVTLARMNPKRRVVFFGIGFETTAPANAMALIAAKRGGVANFSMLASHVLVPPSIASILQARDNRVQAFLGPGHVCAVVGFRAYEALAAHYRVPIVITGFEPVDLMRGVLSAVLQLERGEHAVENAYARSVPREGNPGARAALAEVFDVVDRNWRGIGAIPKSGYRISDRYRAHDADHIFDVGAITTREPDACISGLVLRGVKKPSECDAFGRACTPASPLGATMVSAEGACAAYFQHRRPA
ncbi:MAG: hydrogenase formation protein HypD [Kofleriaceae bacterium]|nr:hydrogenase formation protein HypD [Kofleriaceae bacterium]